MLRLTVDRQLTRIALRRCCTYVGSFMSTNYSVGVRGRWTYQFYVSPSPITVCAYSSYPIEPEPLISPIACSTPTSTPYLPASIACPSACSLSSLSPDFASSSHATILPSAGERDAPLTTPSSKLQKKKKTTTITTNTADKMFPSCARPCPAGVVLLLSAKSGDLGQTKAVLMRSVPSALGGDDVTPLHPDATRDARGNTALHLAAIHGHFEVARVLVDAGASTEAAVISGANEGLTPLRLAAERGHLSTVRVLLAAGADTAAEDLVDRATPLHAAAEAGHTPVVVELAGAGGANLEARAVSGQTPLRWALSLGRAGAAAALLRAGADPDAPDRRGACCLHTVAGLKSEDGLRGDEGAAMPAVLAGLLLSAGATPNLVRGGGREGSSAPASTGGLGERMVAGGGGSECGGVGVGETPLHVAARESSVEVAKMLLLYGADANTKTSAKEGGLSPLHCTAAPGNDDSRRAVVRALLEAGAVIDAASCDGVTPLKLACLNAAVGCVQELLRWGADDVSCVPRCSSSARPRSSSLVSFQPVVVPAPSLLRPTSVSELAASAGSTALTAGQFVGSRVPVSARDETDCQAILHMLYMAPSDRAWRRRGWLVLLYARVTTAAIAAASHQGLRVAPPRLQGAASPAKKTRLLQDQRETRSAKAGDDELREVVCRLFEAQGDQSVLRRVIQWL